MDFRALAACEHPRFDHNGNAFSDKDPLARLVGRKLCIGGALLAKFGDWAYMKQAVGLTGWRGDGPDRRMCWMCKASFAGAHSCSDFTSGASWRGTRVAMNSFYADAVFVSALFGILGFVVRYCRPDWMHVACIGILHDLNRNVMWELFRSLGGTMDNHRNACSKLASMLKVMSKRLGIDPPLDDLTALMMRSKTQNRRN